MESKNEFEKINIKNRACYYLDMIKWKVGDINVNNILLDKKSYENIKVYKILYKNFIDPMPLCIRFDKVDRIIKTYDGIRYLELSNTCNEFIIKFSTSKEIFYNQGNFPQSTKISTIKEIFYSQGNFPQISVSLIKEVFHKQIFLHSQNISCKQKSNRFSKS